MDVQIGKARFSVPEPGDGSTAFIVLGIRKSGSSMLNSMMERVAQVVQLPFVDVAGTFFGAGMPVSEWQDEPKVRSIIMPGVIYGGFRNTPRCLHGLPLYRDSPKVLLVRDPRDALVSEFFSNAYSHSVPQSGEARRRILQQREKAREIGVDAYVKSRVPAFKKTLGEYRLAAADPACRVFRYEEYITRKGDLLTEICAHFGWRPPVEKLHAIAAEFDEFPTEENPEKFVRSVLPGDHKRKLSPATIALIERRMNDVATAFGYAF